MDDEREVSYCCIFQLQCRLCQFALEEGDPVVAYLDDGRNLSYFPFHPVESYQDPVLHIKFHACSPTCKLGDFDAPLFHRRCFEFKRGLLPITPSFLAATAYSFQPSSREVRRRLDLIRRLLPPKLSQALPRQLPLEILTMIAELLVRECAIVTAQEQALERNLPSDFVLDLTRNVYAQYYELDGRYYVKNLQNSCSAKNKHVRLLFDVQNKGSIRKVSIAEDHLGIRSVQFDPSISISSTDPMLGAWWKSITRLAGIARVGVKTDNVKLRDILDISETRPCSDAYVRWATPDHPPSAQVIDLGTLCSPVRFPNWLRMSYFDCNAPGATGYSVATNGVNIAAIHAHGQGDDDVQFYKDVDPAFQWIYMPLDKGEYLVDICRQYRSSVNMDAFGLMFTTNQGRSTMFGCYTPNPGKLDLKRIHTLPQTQSRIWFNAWDSIPEKEVKYLAFDGSCLPVRQPYPSSITPTTPFSGIQSNEPWFFSCCSIKDVLEIIICRDIFISHKPIIGMQLRYTGGHRACVGQFRFDMALENIRVEQGGDLHIVIQRTKEPFLYVAEVTTHPPSNRGERTWINIRRGGYLEWWFSARHCLVRTVIPR